MLRHLRLIGWCFALTIGTAVAAGRGTRDTSRLVLLNDDAGWCWFQDERAIVVGDRLVAGTVASGRFDPTRRGDVDVVSLNLKTGACTRFPLRKNLELDDHDAPSFVALPGGHLLAMYARHGSENRLYQRRSLRPGDATAWSPEEVVVPSETSRVTYSNLHWLADEGRRGRVYQFFRGLDGSFKPSWIVSDDSGASWQRGGILIDVPDTGTRHRPYVKYGSDGRRTIHFAFTEGHPRDFDNGIYHAMISGGTMRRLGGEAVGPLGDAPMKPSDAVPVYVGDSNRVAWIQDLAVDAGGRVRLAFSVQMNSAGKAPGTGGDDHRYHWAEWDGKAWWSAEIAHAGERLYAGEDDYVGGIALHPDDRNVVFISTSVDPQTGVRLPGGHRELFRGRRAGTGVRSVWQWEPLTPGATEDCLRPVVPRWKAGKTALLWVQGRYGSYTDYEMSLRCRLESR